METLVGLVLLVGLLVLYFLPTLIAIARGARFGAVLVINLLVDLTIVGWFVALAMAATAKRAGEPTMSPAANLAPSVQPASAERSETGQFLTPAETGLAESDEFGNILYTRRFLEWCRQRGLLNLGAYVRLMRELEVREDALTVDAELPCRQKQPAPQPRSHRYRPLRARLTSEYPSETVGVEYEWVGGPQQKSPAPAGERLLTSGAAALPAAPPRPAPWSPWLEQLQNARVVVRSDFAVHGLAYLGVLLTFTGTLGFVLFAYSTINNQWLRALGPLVVWPGLLAALSAGFSASLRQPRTVRP